MAYVLAGVSVRNPKTLDEGNSSQYAQQRTLSGAVNRDYFGSNKKVWTLEYENAKKTDFDTINTIYQSYLSTGATQTWAVTETNYTVAQTRVHVVLDTRSFRMQGIDYISSFTLTLIEA